MRDLTKIAMLMMLGFAVACGGGEAPMSDSDDDAMESDAMETEPVASEPMGDPRVFFVAPTDGAELAADLTVSFEFGTENYEISPVPEEVESSRAGIGHYHLGVGAECLPVGEIIPKADPWVHFGDGSKTIDMDLAPGPHTFSVQMGDDEHRTLEGLCETISIELVEGI
jgi:hypothetical protein